MTVTLHLGDCAEVLQTFPANCVDLTVTSPPYDNLRTYKGYSFDFQTIAQQLYRVTRPGGVVVWVVGDATIRGSETGTSFRQALYFKEIGFNLHDTMIWNKGGFTAVGSLRWRYAPVFEYMFVLSKGSLRTFNPIKDHKNIHAGTSVHGTVRQPNGSFRKVSGAGTKKISDVGQRFNIWDIYPVRHFGNTHPAAFPEALARDHILSWSNENDMVMDCFLGRGTTGKMARILNRNFIGIEISPEYLDMAKRFIWEDK